uniref:helix-turn-helix domain-containing protein n=1 Tax=Faecalibacterium prausnitzii TaxID=853 RepID=UPI004038F664
MVSFALFFLRKNRGKEVGKTLGGRHLTLADRKIIEERWLAGDSVADIAEYVG